VIIFSKFGYFSLQKRSGYGGNDAFWRETAKTCQHLPTPANTCQHLPTPANTCKELQRPAKSCKTLQKPSKPCQKTNLKLQTIQKHSAQGSQSQQITSPFAHLLDPSIHTPHRSTETWLIPASTRGSARESKTQATWSQISTQQRELWRLSWAMTAAASKMVATKKTTATTARP
jgi:hypothetical protein